MDPSLLYYVLFKIGTECRIINSFCAVLECFLVFHWSAVQVGGTNFAVPS